jgi:acyl carrier protein
LSHASLLAIEPGQRQTELEAFLREQVARILGMDPARLDLDRPLDTLGLDSLMAMELKNSLESKLGIKLSPASLLQGPTISSLAAESLKAPDEAGASPDEPFLVATEHSEESPLSLGQQALWFLHQLLPEGTSFNVAGAARILGPLDLAALERAFQVITARHESLRSTFHVVAGEPIQRLHPSMDGVFTVEDASAWSESQLRDRLAAEAHRPFELEHGPVWRAVLFRRRASVEHILLLSMDHIVTDFWSMTVLARELLTSYEANKAGRKPPSSGCRRAIRITSAGRQRCWRVNRGRDCGTTGGKSSRVRSLS